ncbi:hypothetical protein AgCh_012735 [Apium graveolens]
MDSSESRHWKGAVKSEIDSIISNGTWELVDLPHGCSTIRCKWIFKRKLNPDDSIDKYKARLVAKGFRQRECIDYFDTYSPVSRMTTIRMLIALASIHGLIIHQMDVKTTFLHGDLEEEIYMDQPEGFVASGNERKVCRLVKSIYGLKQAPIDCHKKFDETVLDFDFLVNESDKCVYYKIRGNDCVIVCLYVDDILLFGTNIEIINETQSFLKRHFEMKDMDKASLILGIKLTQSTDGIILSQSHDIEKSILEKYGYSNCRIASTPYNSKVALVENSSGIPVSQLRYSQIIGSLQYLANVTRPDISYSVSKLARYTSCPNKTHWEALDRVLRYLKGIISLGGAVSWKSSKQTLITRSTFEAELCALDTTGTEAEWIIAIEFIGTQDNIADPLTKGLEHARKGLFLEAFDEQDRDKTITSQRPEVGSSGPDGPGAYAQGLNWKPIAKTI